MHSRFQSAHFKNLRASGSYAHIHANRKQNINTKKFVYPFSKVGLLKLVVRQEAESENPTILRVTWLPSRHGGDFFPAEMTNIILPHYSSCAFLLSCSVTSLLGSTLIVRVTFRASCF